MLKIAAASLVFLSAACASYNMAPAFAAPETPPGLSLTTFTAPETPPAMSLTTFAAPETPPGMPQPGGADTMDAYRAGAYRMSGSFVFQDIEGGNFQLGHVSERWDSAYRYELDFLFHFPMQSGHIEPLADAYVYWENRDWTAESISKVDYDTIGFGLGTGINAYAFKGGEHAKFNMGLMPYGRIGMGFQSGSFDNMPSSQGYSTGNIDGYRYELTLGLDAHVMFFSKLKLALGGGFTYWGSTDQDAVTKNAAGITIDRNDSISFRGNDLFLRGSVGFKF